MCTFHALGVRLLRQDGHVLGLKPQFSILDSDDVTSILKDAGGTTDAATARQWQWAISLWKNLGLNAAQAEVYQVGGTLARVEQQIQHQREMAERLHRARDEAQAQARLQAVSGQEDGGSQAAADAVPPVRKEP